MSDLKKWQPVFLYFVGDMIETPEDTKQVVLWAGHTGSAEPLWKQKRGEYTDDYGVRWQCVVLWAGHTGSVEPFVETKAW
jgi:hypothetical protein